MHDAGYKRQDEKDTGYMIQGEKNTGLYHESCIVHRASCIGSHHAPRITHHALRNERGIALVMVLVLSAIMLAIIAALVYMLTSGTQVSGIQKRYRTALEAGQGGKDVTAQTINLKASESEIIALIKTNLGGEITTPVSCIAPSTADLLPDGTSCNAHYIADCAATAWPTYRGLCVKLNLPTYCWSGCDSSLTINPPSSGDNTTYDFRFNLGDYRAHAKIVDTVWGNSSKSTENLGSGKGVVDTGTEISGVSVPYLYTIEVDAENPNNSQERGKLSVLYQY